MTNDEWDAIGELLDQCWKGDFDERRADAYRTFLLPLDARVVMLALQKLARNGSPFLPTVPEILKAVEEPVPPPPWVEAWPRISAALRRPTAEGTQEALADDHPALGRFVGFAGWSTLRGLPVDDPQYGPLEVRRLGESYDAFVTADVERDRRGRALRAAGVRGELGRFDPIAALGIERPRELEAGA